MCVIKTIQELCCSEFGYVLTQLLCECYFFMRIILVWSFQVWVVERLGEGRRDRKVTNILDYTFGVVQVHCMAVVYAVAASRGMVVDSGGGLFS